MQPQSIVELSENARYRFEGKNSSFQVELHLDADLPRVDLVYSDDIKERMVAVTFASHLLEGLISEVSQ